MSPFFKIVAQFDPFDYDIGMYFTDAECAKCGALVTAPTPIDHPDFNNKHKQGE